MRRAGLLITASVLAGLFMVATFVLGWGAVPLTGAIWGVGAGKRDKPAWEAALAATLGWSAWLLWDSVQGPVGRLGGQLGSLFGIPATLLFAMTLGWPAALAATSARLGAEIRTALESRHRNRQIRGESPSTPQPGSTPDA
jgi:hypothetical protein